MSQGHHQPAAAPWAWPLQDCAAATLRPESVGRWLRVESGLVWVTAQDARPQGDDLWLEAGASLELPAGTAWVLQAWPQARLSLALQAPQSTGFSRGAGVLRRWGTALLRRLRAAQRPGGWNAQPL